MSRAKKGGAFERDTSRKLSLWWSEGVRDDCFWRVGGSGGRAKVRGRKGKATKGQSGDIFASDPIAEKFIDFFTVELKKGYNNDTVMDIIDKPIRETKTDEVYQEFFEQVFESHKDAESLAWMLIHKRDLREAVVYIPLWVADKFDIRDGGITPHTEFFTKIRYKEMEKRLSVYGCRFENFLDMVSPGMVKEVYEACK